MGATEGTTLEANFNGTDVEEVAADDVAVKGHVV